MKKRLLTLLLTGTLTMSMLAGCGSASDTETDATSQAQEETVVEDVETPTEEIVVEETAVEESTEMVEETTEVAEAEPITFERENHIITACMTNLSSETTFGRLVAEDADTFNTNDYLDVDVMTELLKRGYDIEGFTVTWMVAVNEDGVSNWADLGELAYSKVNDTGEHYAKLYPLFIKDSNVDTSRNLWNKYSGNDCWIGVEEYNSDAWNIVHKAIYDMKQDENYTEIDFNIPDTDFVKYFESVSQARQADDENVLIKNFTINDWYNGMVYAMFESKTIDLDGFFDCCIN